MASILRPFASLITPGTYQVPVGPLTIDWTHPLAYGLIGCWVPGVMFGNDLVTNKVMTYDLGAVLDSTLDGVGVRATTAGKNGGQYWIVNSANEPFMTAPASGGPGLSLFWRGAFVGAASSFNVWAGVVYDNTANTSPFAIFEFAWDGAGHVQLRFNAGGGGNITGAATPTANVPFDMVGVYNVPITTTQFYVNGVNAGSTGGQVGANNNYPTTVPAIVISRYNFATAGPSGVNTTLFAGWNRPLSAGEAMALHLNPYAFLMPAEADTFISQLPAPDTFANFPGLVMM